MKNIRLCLAALLLSSCTDWLQVEPYDQILEGRLFGSEQSVQVALNGLYLNFADASLYGRDLTNRTVEILAQRYYSSAATETGYPLSYFFSSYSYNVDATKNRLEAIWRQAYEVQLNVNNFIAVLEKSEGALSASRRNLCLGEAYGLRAFLYFDMMRLFGPIEVTSYQELSIPYYTLPEALPHDRESAAAVMQKIMDDVERALALLQDDPVVANGAAGNSDDAFWGNRQWRMNYYAVSALKLRALMLARRTAEAYLLAQQLIEQVNTSFPWARQDSVMHANRPDKVFMSEVLFGLYSTNMYSAWTASFSPGVSLPALLSSATSNVRRNFDTEAATMSESPDWRARQWHAYPLDGAYMTNHKFERSSDVSRTWYYQPLIRKSELFYAFAELSGDMQWVDSVRVHRGLKRVAEVKPADNVTHPAVLEREILNEYHRELYGEGQLFFYYKRKRSASIQNGSPGNVMLDMRLADYVLPVPQKELDW
jgi:hypothetical protein